MPAAGRWPGPHGTEPAKDTQSDDIFCADGPSIVAHLMYVQNGLADQGATFAASEL